MITTDIKTAYPTPVEIVRVLANALDTKSAANAKYLDDQAKQLDADHRVISGLITDFFYKPLKDKMGVKTAKFICENIDWLLSSYFNLVGRVPLDGLPRDECEKLLVEHFFSHAGSAFLSAMLRGINGPNPALLVAKDGRALDVLISWLEENNESWRGYISGCSKEQKDRIARWRKGLELPLLSSIKVIPNSPMAEGAGVWQEIRTLLMFARVIDWCKSTVIGTLGIDTTRHLLWKPDHSYDVGRALLLAQVKYNQRYSELTRLGLITQEYLKPSYKKTNESKQQIRNFLDQMRELQQQLDTEGNCSYFISWLEAKWYVFCGDLEQARKYYHQAFEQSLFRAGEHQKTIIEEAMIISASLSKPDKVFLKRLKNILILFGYQIPLFAQATVKQKQSFKASEIIEEWEIDACKGHFCTTFPPVGMFPGCSFGFSTPKVGPLIVSDISKITPDYKKPDRRIKVGDTWKKITPQLVWFSELNKVDVVEKLLEAGANVNVFSESGETPLLMAVQAINVMEIPFASLDDSLFNLISQHPHGAETVNKTTEKLKLLPLISAVGSGRYDVVKKLLDMGATADERGQTDGQTALHYCMKMIGTLKDPEFFIKQQVCAPMTPEVLDSIRRHTRGAFGFDLESQDINHPRHAEIKELLCREMTERLLKNLSIDELRKIAVLLIENGADANAEHTSPINGYTPLMFAAEKDEVELFSRMLEYGGNPKKHYMNLDDGRYVNCWAIAHYFQATRVLKMIGVNASRGELVTN